MKYTAVIFDLDGTVLDTLDDLTASVNFALGKVGLKSRTRDEIRSFLGNGAGYLLKKSMGDGADEKTMKEVLDHFGSHYMEHCNDMTHPYDDIIALTDRIREAGIKCAVLSNKPDKAVKALCALHFGNRFDLCVGEREGVRRKPYPDGVFEITEMFGVNKDDVLYVGDSEVDVGTARNAGVDCAAVSWGFRDVEVLEEAGADVIVSSVSELEKLIFN